MKALVNKSARVLIADDHPIMRNGLAQLLTTQNEMICCGESSTGAETLRLVEELKPDLLILDLRLKNGDGLELIKSLCARIEHLKILVISEHEQPLFAERALRAGALGYLVKDASAEAVLAAIRAVLAGNMHLSENIARRLLQGVVSTNSGSNLLASLSDRQLHVLYLLGCGLSTREISNALNVSFKTVETHRENLKRRLKVRTASELLHLATSMTQGDLLGLPQKSLDSVAA
jgi:DNA-binding NarL/FixJ family response regulator